MNHRKYEEVSIKLAAIESSDKATMEIVSILQDIMTLVGEVHNEAVSLNWIDPEP